MQQVSLDLPPELERFINDKVSSGEFRDVNDVIRHAIDQMREEEAEWTPEVLAYYRREVAIGLEQARRGELAEYTAEDVIAEGRARMRREAGS